MVRLVQKCGYIKGGRAARYMKYIATRSGVEKMTLQGKATKKQRQLISKLLCDFPDAKQLFEYDDYLKQPTAANASAFITMTLDANAHRLNDGSGYMQYIATRPRAERHGAHGLFGAAQTVSLEKTLSEVEKHQGNVWTVIYSLRREDAVRLGYDHAAAWRDLLLRHEAEIANVLNVSPKQLRWYAAFHDEGSHPHIHMMMWVNGLPDGYLTKEGVLAMRSQMTGDIFKDELYEIYAKKDMAYKEVSLAARKVVRELAGQMTEAECDSPVIAAKLTELSERLQTVSGKKQYGYLPRPMKRLVDSIVDELAKLPEVAECYAAWNKLRDVQEGFYKNTPRQHQPLSKQKEFKAVRNMVIREAAGLRLAEPVLAESDVPLDHAKPDSTVHIRNPAVMAAATRLLHHMGNIFREQSQPKDSMEYIRIDSKRRRKLMAKRLAIGHKPDDHEIPIMK